MTAPLDDIPGDRSPDRPPHPAGDAPAPRPARRRLPLGLGRLLRWWLVVGTLLLLAVVAFVCISGVTFDFRPLHVNISGDDFADGITVVGLTPGAKALLGAGALVVVFTLLMVLPLLLLMFFLVLTLVVTCAVVFPILGLAIALAALTSPIWIVGLVVWLVLRRKASRAAAPSARVVSRKFVA